MISLRFLITGSFCVLLLICGIGFWMFLSTDRQKQAIRNYHLQLKSARILLLEANEEKERMHDGQELDSLFYYGQHSGIERSLQALFNQCFRSINHLDHSIITKDHHLHDEIVHLIDLVSKHRNACNKLVELYKMRGFKDYGVEGQMRDHAHRIYDLGDDRVKFICLQLRRHEKDFLLRKNLDYVHKFTSVLKELRHYLVDNPSVSVALRTTLLFEANEYERFFRHLVSVETRIGTARSGGQLKIMEEVFNEISAVIEHLDSRVHHIDEETATLATRKMFCLSVILISFLLATIALLTSTLTRSVKALSTAFDRYTNSGFNFEVVSAIRSHIREFSVISVGFLKMAREINIYTNFFREKVLERTKEIHEQKEEIQRQQEQITAQYSRLLRKNSLLRKRKLQLAQKNKDLKDSLHYAKRIQKVMQPRFNNTASVFSETFAFSKARDVVSGDFYMLFDLPGAEESRQSLIVVADCTGHGVPGAFMSIIGTNLLRSIVIEKNNTDPGLILNHLNHEVSRLLSAPNQDTSIQDGMEISIAVFDPVRSQLRYANSRLQNFLVRSGQITQLDTHRNSIGLTHVYDPVPEFRTSTIEVQKGDVLYLFSDGLQDQFGGPKNKKFKKSNIARLIKDIHHHPLKTQRRRFRQTFEEWRGDKEQTDDILVVGLRF